MIARLTKKRKLLKWILIGTPVVFALLALILTFLPVLLSTSPAVRRIAGAVGAWLGTEVEVKSLRLSWFGSQRVEGLRVASPGTSGPEPDLPNDDLFRASRVVLKSGLLRLVASKSDPIEVEVEEPELRISRDARGRFNFEGLARGEAGQEEPDSKRETPSKPSGKAEGGGLSRGVSFTVQRGKVFYRDEVLGTASTVEELSLTLEAGPSEAHLDARGKIRAEGGAPGSFQVSVAAMDLGAEGREPIVSGTAEVKDLDLRPYDALLEKALRMRAPEKPLTGNLVIETGEKGLEVKGGLDAGFARLDGLAWNVPRKGLGSGTTLVVPWSLDLPATLAALGPLAAAPQGARAGGRAAGTLSVSAPVTFEDLASRSLSGVPVDIKLDGKFEDLDISWPRPPGKEGSPGPEPFRLSRKGLDFSLRAAAPGKGGELRVESARVSADGIEADLTASVMPEGGTTSSGVAGGRVVNLGLSLRLAVSELVTLLGVALPQRVEIAPESVVRIENLSLRGKEGAAPADWEGKGRIEIQGPLKYGGISMTGLSSDLRLGGKRLDLSGLACGLNGGKVQADELSLGLEGTPEFRIALRSEGVAAHYDMAPLLSYVLPFLPQADVAADFAGAIQSGVEISGRGFTLDDLRRNLRGKGALRITDGRIGASPLFKELATMLRGDLDRVLFDALGSDFTIGEGKISCAKVFLQGKEGGKLRSLALEGVTGIDGSLDYGVKLASLKETIGDKKIRRVLDYAEKFLGEGTLPLKLRGTLSKPKLEIEPTLGGIDLGGMDLGGLLEGRLPLPEAPGDASEGAPPAEGSPGASQDAPGDSKDARGAPRNPREALQRGLRDLLDSLKKSEGPRR